MKALAAANGTITFDGSDNCLSNTVNKEKDNMNIEKTIEALAKVAASRDQYKEYVAKFMNYWATNTPDIPGLGYCVFEDDGERYLLVPGREDIVTSEDDEMDSTSFFWDVISFDELVNVVKELPEAIEQLRKQVKRELGICFPANLVMK